MKTNNLIIVLLIVAVSFLLGHTFANNQTPAKEDGRTEEYAIMHVSQFHMRKMVKITIISPVGTEEKEFNKVENEEGSNFILKELQSLNIKGFELFDSNYAYAGSSEHLYTYVFKRKL